ncbi:hypothetical protein CGCF415_v013166 [Colletotrichum fructicola]|nr:uncharacterized protein CGMCC3_g2346 [Colletotrichum fructicola]KAE9581643.1 hypothetical protein CGMCC3_g2346 [Colletotrichum fructicola]KAF4891188.1 hypothetical protein CGCFRS4_v008355 [Colletotrichum fructicola]KAF4891952.1 hypothetical protein CGCF415_v013166 [Colletotrichum fructicola]
MITSTVPRWPIIPADEDHLQLYRTSKMEMACRFSKDHFDKGGLCDCNRTNIEPELHNIAVAMRQTVARTYLYPREGTHPTPVLVGGKIVYVNEQKKEYAWDDPVNAGHTFRDEAMAKMAGQSDLSQLNHLKRPTSVGEIQVIPFFMDIWDNDKAHIIMSQSMEHDWNMKEGGIEAWYEKFLGHYGNEYDSVKEIELNFRMRLINTANNLVINDCGLTFLRMFQVMRIFKNILFFEMEDWGKDPQLTPACASKLAELCRQGARPMPERKLLFGEPVGFGGDAWFDQLRMLGMHHYFHRNRSLHREDEFASAAAIQNTVMPLSEEEIAALSDEDRECAICEKEMGWPLEGHAAMRIKCPSRHRVGMNCWMKTCRLKRLSERGRDINCHSCADSKVGEWHAVESRDRVFAVDVRDGYFDKKAQLEWAMYRTVYRDEVMEPQAIIFDSYTLGWGGYPTRKDHRDVSDESHCTAVEAAHLHGDAWRQSMRPWNPAPEGVQDMECTRNCGIPKGLDILCDQKQVLTTNRTWEM